MYDSSDHVTGKTGLSPTVLISKDGATFASPSGLVTEIGNGFYQVAGNSTDSNTLGVLLLTATASGADQGTMAYQVVAFDPDTIAVGALMPTTAGRTLDVTSTGAAGIDWGNVENQGATVDLTDTEIHAVNSVISTPNANVISIQGQNALAAGAVTFPGTVASPTNITAGTITTVTNLTNAPTNGDFTATMKASLNASTPSVPVPTANENADALLKRDWTAVVGEASRSVLNALRFIRNGFSTAGTTLSILKEDDVTVAYTRTVTTDPTAEPIVGVD